ncbi:Ig-like domain-containing protein [Actinoplanes sp. NPDC023714]|uniref:Ig-like domain-containing protein n=1 Tax=Actinoplanes sp. NPDC023714 TaxID=3154322 RepID=UPI0033DA909F
MTYRFAAFLTAVALLALTGVAVTTREASAAITDPFVQQFGINANGAVMLRGNANLRCPAAATGCTAGQGGSATTGQNESLNNNGYDMAHNNTDSDPVTFNHSAATVTLPAGSTVLYAALYWSADTKAGTNGTAATTPADKGKVLFRTPAGGGWTTITRDRIYAPTSLTAYQAVADVTSLVSGGRSGTYEVANIQSGTGRDRYAGWALAIAYHDDGQPMRSLRIYDGFGVVSSASTSLTIDIAGFQTRQSGAVDTDIGTVVYEGDLGKTGDTLKLDTNAMGDTLNPANNFFNSTVSEADTAVAGRDPAWSNLMGVDIDQYNANGRLANGATSASLTLTTNAGGETFYPGVVTFTTTLYAPKLVTVITPTDMNGGDVLPGDEIEYRILVRNDGTDTAGNSTLIDAIPTGTTFVPGSIAVAGVASDDSPYAGGKVTFGLGTLAYGQSTYVTYRVRVNDSTRPGADIVNVPNTSYQGSTSPLVLTGIGDADTRTVRQPDTDLRAAVTVSPSVVQRAVASNPVNYTIGVTNRGPNMEPEPTAVLDLPAGVTPSVTQPAGCSASGQRITCTLGALASGSTGTVTVPAVADGSAATTATATLTVSGIGADPAPADNTATADLRVNAAPQPQPETAGADGGTPVTIPVRANDTDPDDATNTLTVSVTTAPLHGWTVVNADQTVTYTPEPGWRGTDTFTYTLTDPQLGTGTATVTVTTGNTPPAAVDDQIATARGRPVTVPVLANDTDANGDTRTLLSVTQPAPGTGTVTISGDDVNYTPPSSSYQGAAVFTYTISDGNGGTATGNVRVDVGNTVPVAADDTGVTGYLGTVTVPVLANDTDPDGDTLSVLSVTQPAGGTGTVVIDGTGVRYTAPAGFSGDATFSYTVSDGNGGTATAQVVVTVANAPPVAVDKTATTAYGTPVTVDAVAGSSDPNGDPRSVLSTTAAGNGSVVRNADGTVTYTPNMRFSGVDQFDYTLADGRGGTATARITVTVANGVPVARDDTVTATSNAPVTIDVRANDTDPNDDPLTVTVDTPPAHGTARVVGGRVVYTPAAGYHGPDSFHYTVSDGRGGSAGATATITVLNVAPVARADSVATDSATAVTIPVLDNDTDPNGDALSVSATTAPAHGTVVRTAAGTLVYTPAPGFVGIDAFTYTVVDPAGLSDTTTVTVTVHNAPPIAVDDRFPVEPGRATTLPVLANDIDPNTGQTLTVVSVGRAGKGTVRLTGGTVVYTPEKGATGTDTFTYVITDDRGETDEATVTVVIDELPSASPDTASTTSGKAVDIDVTANDTDPEGGALTVVSAGKPAHGTARVVGGRVRYTPKTGFTGRDAFSYTVKDAAGHSVTSTVTVTVTPAPVLPAAPDKAVRGEPGKPLLITMPSTDRSGHQIKIKSIGTPENGTARLNSDGTVTYTPKAGFRGTDTFTYDAVDASGTVLHGTITVTVAGANRPPTATNDRYATSAGKPISIEPAADDSDPDADHLTLVRVGKAGHGTAVIDGNGHVTYAPDDGFTGTDTFTYTVGDGHGGTATATVTVTVSDHLARTGADISSVLNTGVAILLLGGVLYTATLHSATTPGRHRPGRHKA